MIIPKFPNILNNLKIPNILKNAAKGEAATKYCIRCRA